MTVHGDLKKQRPIILSHYAVPGSHDEDVVIPMVRKQLNAASNASSMLLGVSNASMVGKVYHNQWINNG